LRLRPIVVREIDPVMCIPNPIHDPQRQPRQKSVSSVVLQDDETPTNALGLGKHYCRIGRVVKDVDEHRNIEAFVRHRNAFAIEDRHRNHGRRSRDHVDSLKRAIRSESSHARGETTVAAANIQDGGILRQHLSNPSRQNVESTIANEAVVDGINKAEPVRACGVRAFAWSRVGGHSDPS